MLDEMHYTPDEKIASSRRWVAGAMFGLMGFGLVAGYSANVAAAMREHGALGDLVFLRAHLVKVIVALLAFVACARLRTRHVRRAAWPLFAVAVGLVFAVLFYGTEVNNARRWFRVAGTSFQPSEVARVAVVVVVAWWMARMRDRTKTFGLGVVVPFALAAVPAAFVLVEPDYGSAVVILFMAVLSIWVGGARITHLCGLFAVALGTVSVYGWTKLGHVQRRVAGFTEPEVGSQVWQSLTALGHGGATGRGIGSGLSTWGFLPEADSDFVFAVVGEEFGLLGTTTLLALYGVLLFHGVRILMGLRSRFALVVGTGLLMQVAVQVVLNVAVVTASAPPKGLPLPFVSLGGTSLLVLCASLGLLLGMARSPQEDPWDDARPAAELSEAGATRLAAPPRGRPT